MLQISEKEVEKRLRFDNPWWVAGRGIDESYINMPERAYLSSFVDLVRQIEINRAVILMGPRRVGKTVMVNQTIRQLLEDGVAGSAILYISLETPIYTDRSLENILNLFKTIHRHREDSKLYVFFDEIQYLKKWEVHLKSLVDSYRSCRFVATGSAAATLRAKSIESGAGRFTDFMLPPLTFAEYLNFVNLEKELIEVVNTKVPVRYKAKDLYRLNKEFVNYLNFGGYPEAVLSKTIQSDSSRYIKADIIDKVLLRDLPSLYGISDIQELNRLFNTLAYNTGNEITLEELSKTSNVAKATLKNYLDYLEAAFLIKRIHKLDENAKRFKRAVSFKVYLTNPSMRSALFGSVTEDDEAMGRLAETAVFSQWLHSAQFIDTIYYARWQRAEIDIVGLDAVMQKPKFIVEVKWSDRAYDDFREIKGVIEFSKKHKLIRRPLVTTLTKEGIGLDKKEKLEIEFTPCSVHCYTIARNVLTRN